MLTKISTGLTALVVLITVYFLIRPERILAKRPHLTLKSLRIRLGITLALGLLALGLRLPALMEKEAPTDPKMAEMETIFSERLSRYTDQAKSRAFTKSCVPFQIAEVKKQYPQLTEKVLDLAALDTCSCMAHYLGDLPEFAKVEGDIIAGKGYEPSMNAHMDTNVMMEKARPCMEQ